MRRPANLARVPAKFSRLISPVPASVCDGLDVFEMAATAMGIVTPSGQWLRANAALATLLDEPREQLVGQHIVDQVVEEDREKALAGYQHVLDQNAATLRIELQVQAGAGPIWTRQRLSALRVDDKPFPCILAQLEDITELKRMEQRQQRRANFSETVIQNLPGVLVGSFDRDLRYQLIQGEGLAAQGLSSDVFVGKTPSEILGPERADEVGRRFRAVLDGEPQRYNADFGGRTYDVRAVPLYEPDGSVGSGVVVYIDITDLKEAEASRQRRGEIYRTIVRNLPGSVAAIFDRDLRYLLVEGTGLEPLGLTSSMVEGKTAYEFWGADRRDEVVQHLQQALDGNPQEYEGRINGREFEIRALPIHDADGSINYGVVLNFDITERKVREREIQAVSEALAQSNKELEQFASVASHDLRAPLVTMQGLATMLAEDYADDLDEDGRYLVNRIIANSEQMRTLLTELLEISRVRQDQTPTVVVDLGTITDIIAEQQSAAIQERDAQVSSNLHGVEILANRTRMIQLFGNLLDNAMKYTPTDRQPVIAFEGVEDDDYWLITVTDNGVGIPEEYREKVFSMFQRLLDGKALNPDGTGMGLALVERIVNLHGGHIWVDQYTDSGTRFCILFPKSEPAEESSQS